MNQRQLFVDTETTGLSPGDGHRVVEIACVEYIDRQATGNIFHTYLNPQRNMPPEALAIHGLDDDFLFDQPLFADQAQAFIDFIRDAALVIHNAPFDVSFLNNEITLYNNQLLSHEHIALPRIDKICHIEDSLVIAKNRFTGNSSLDALCTRFKIDKRSRHVHGALIDAELLGKVYIAMTSTQGTLSLHLEKPSTNNRKVLRDNVDFLRVLYANKQEQKAHQAYIAKLNE